MDFWDPYDRMRRRRMMEQQRRRMAEEAARRAEEERLRRQPPAGQATPSQGSVLERFERELAQARRERDEWADRYKALFESLSAQQQALQEQQERLQAEEEEQKTRARQEAEQQRERVLRNAEQRAFSDTRDLLTRLLAVADDFDRVLRQSGAEGDPWLEGVKLVYRHFQRALELAGVERVNSAGEMFDPAKHEAVAQVPREGAVSGMIVEEVAAGYLYKGALLRPASVIVAA